uniref:Uncharacterized protein n=1 Tax=Trypanosoma congolense (strain IL3000) TaxID=1068625 RepID=F9W8Y3_TRYCI|nr:hypothetical protein, unlikely [Trypanosoma congolense IL3000]
MFAHKFLCLFDVVKIERWKGWCDTVLLPRHDGVGALWRVGGNEWNFVQGESGGETQRNSLRVLQQQQEEEGERMVYSLLRITCASYLHHMLAITFARSLLCFIRLTGASANLFRVLWSRCMHLFPKEVERKGEKGITSRRA